MAKFGLIGKNIDYSFSKNFFSKKFEKENLPHSYENFDIVQITDFPEILEQNPRLKGFNVTIPYKEQIIPYLDSVEKTAAEIGAVNTVKIYNDGRLQGFNTDYFGFSKGLEEFLPLNNKKALILGTGGASKAVDYALQQLGFTTTFVSRKSKNHTLAYNQLNQVAMEENCLIVNCTPLGTFPNTERFPPLPYHFITPHHLLFDLIYNPAVTLFMQKGHQQGAQVTNGLRMLEMQAEKAWEIWNG